MKYPWRDYLTREYYLHFMHHAHEHLADALTGRFGPSALSAWFYYRSYLYFAMLLLYTAEHTQDAKDLLGGLITLHGDQYLSLLYPMHTPSEQLVKLRAYLRRRGYASSIRRPKKGPFVQLLLQYDGPRREDCPLVPVKPAR